MGRYKNERFNQLELISLFSAVMTLLVVVYVHAESERLRILEPVLGEQPAMSEAWGRAALLLNLAAGLGIAAGVVVYTGPKYLHKAKASAARFHRDA